MRVVLTLPVDVDTWAETPQEKKDDFRETIERLFSDAQRKLGYNDVRVVVRIYIVQKDERVEEVRQRRLQSNQQIVTNTGDCIVVVEIIVPPDTTAVAVRSNLEEDVLEVRSGEDSAVNQAISSQTTSLGLGSAVVTSTTIEKVPLIASPPPPSPENFTPYTDLSLVFIVVGTVIGMFLLIVLARECDAERIRIGTNLFSAFVRRITGGKGKDDEQDDEEDRTVTVVVPPPSEQQRKRSQTVGALPPPQESQGSQKT